MIIVDLILVFKSRDRNGLVATIQIMFTSKVFSSVNTQKQNGKKVNLHNLLSKDIFRSGRNWSTGANSSNKDSNDFFSFILIHTVTLQLNTAAEKTKSA